jgi:2-hydroxymuconate-semialdehyde hydrolase
MEFREYDVGFDAHSVRCYEAGTGMPLLLIHGIGPGTSIKANFSSVMGPLAERYRVIAFDLVGFGGSSRKTAAPYFDFDLWIRQAQFMLGRVPEGPVNVIGHSMGGAIALRLALSDRRVENVVTSGAAGGTLKLNRAIETFWRTPRAPEDIRNAMKVGMFDHASITDALIEERFAVARSPGYAEYFEKMLSGDKQKLLDCARISPAELAEIKARVMILHGRNDQPCPPEETALVVYRDLKRADLHLLHSCGHAIPREHPETLLTLARLWFG